MTDGAFTYEDLFADGGPRTWRWDSAEALARDFWIDQAKPEERDHVGPAWNCIWRMTNKPDPRVLDVIQCLVDVAPDEDGRGFVGALVIEDLFLYSDNGDRFVDAAAELAQRSPNFREALEAMSPNGVTAADLRAEIASFRERHRDS